MAVFVFRLIKVAISEITKLEVGNLFHNLFDKLFEKHLREPVGGYIIVENFRNVSGQLLSNNVLAQQAHHHLLNEDIND